MLLFPYDNLNLNNCRWVCTLSYIFKIASWTDHPLFITLLSPNQPPRITRVFINLNDYAFFISPNHRTLFSKCLIHVMIRLWNMFPNCVVHSKVVGGFKLWINLFLLPWLFFYSLTFSLLSHNVVSSLSPFGPCDL